MSYPSLYKFHVNEEKALSVVQMLLFRTRIDVYTWKALSRRMQTQLGKSSVSTNEASAICSLNHPTQRFLPL